MDAQDVFILENSDLPKMRCSFFCQCNVLILLLFSEAEPASEDKTASS